MKSQLHTKVFSLLREIYPYQIIKEEKTIKLVNGKNLFVDIYIPALDLMVECDGIQHFEYTPRFHKDKWDFYGQKMRDERKELWCQDNNISLVRFAYWEEKLLTKEYVADKVSLEISS